MTTQTYSADVQLQSKPKSNNAKVLKLFALAIFASLCLLLGAVLFTYVAKPVYQNPQAGQFNYVPVSSEVMLQVEKKIRAKFMAGEWRFADIEQRDGIVQVYIQIPERLTFTGEAYHNYVRQSVCPSANDNVWDHIPSQQLNIHLYSMMKAQSVSTLCG